MPAKSGKQMRAMMAAAHGRSTIGIPRSVGQSFVAHTPPEKRSRLMRSGMRAKAKQK